MLHLDRALQSNLIFSKSTHETLMSWRLTRPRPCRYPGAEVGWSCTVCFARARAMLQPQHCCAALLQPAGYLDGSEPGDYGFDPLRSVRCSPWHPPCTFGGIPAVLTVCCRSRLGANKERFSWFREAELTNGR